ncbi:hypothetical protein [Fodinicola acaciae]|uniref:hypothetical protein n=1 Tax=Fodinicola acaciae TaxID=2681555 RepID=UPI0013D29061|nr:hypothetical protein [Fodinicola acaciae]
MSRLLRELTGRAIQAAARRWPEAERADAVAEWQAELHEIGDHPWQAFRYATSLALARTDRDLGVAPSGAGRHVGSAVVLVAVPIGAAVLSFALLIAITIGMSSAGGAASTDWYVGLSLLLIGTPLGFLGRRLGRRSPHAGGPQVATWTTAVLAIAALAFAPAYYMLPWVTVGMPYAMVYGTVVWAAVLWLAGWGLVTLRRIGRDLAATLVAVTGGIAAWVAGVLVAGLLTSSAAEASRAYALLWPVLLLVDPLDSSTAIGSHTIMVVDELFFLPFLLIPATVFGLAYLAGAGRRTDQARVPALDTA